MSPWPSTTFLHRPYSPIFDHPETFLLSLLPESSMSNALVPHVTQWTVGTRSQHLRTLIRESKSTVSRPWTGKGQGDDFYWWIGTCCFFFPVRFSNVILITNNMSLIYLFIYYKYLTMCIIFTRYFLQFRYFTPWDTGLSENLKKCKATVAFQRVSKTCLGFPKFLEIPKFSSLETRSGSVPISKKNSRLREFSRAPNCHRLSRVVCFIPRQIHLPRYTRENSFMKKISRSN